MIRTFAAIDIGSYELEMGVYEMSDKIGVREIDHVKKVVRLGVDTYKDGKISYRMVEAVCEVLGQFTQVMKGYQAETYRAYVSSALRKARNSQIVLDQIRVRTGINIQAISNSEQRLLNYKAIAAKDAEFQRTIQKGTAIVSAGFGSLQVSLFDKDALVSTQNLPLGAISLREIINSVQLDMQTEQGLIGELIDNELVTFRKIYLKDREVKNLIAVGEPMVTFYNKFIRPEYGRQRISAEEFSRPFEIIGQMPPDRLADRYDINVVMAELLYPAAAILKRMMDLTGAETMWIPCIRMTDGIAVEYAEEKRLVRFNHDFVNDIIVTSRNMAKRYKCFMPHIQAVEAHALQVFDVLKKYHGLKSRERLLMQIAAVLHSCGKFVTMREPTVCAYNIIMGTEIIGLSHVEREIVANVVKFHIQKFSYNEVKIEESVTRDTRLATPDNLNMMIAKLTAILRLANSMDRAHKQKLEGCRMAVKDNELVITTDYNGDVTLERVSIAQKADFFEEIFGIRPVLKQKKRV